MYTYDFTTMKPLAFADCWYWFLLGAVISYFMGCFHFAVVISKLKHDDIRHVGSGNPGAMNISRRFGLKYGFINFFCDGLKGIIPAACGFFIFKNYYFEGTQYFAVADFARYLFPLFALLGHIFPVTSKFKGGKGISTAIGFLWFCVSCEVWWYAFLGLLLFILLFVYVGFTEWGSMGSLIGVAGFTVWQAVIFTIRYSGEMMSNVYVVLTFMMLLFVNVLTWGAHHRNLYQLMAGEEHRTSLKKMLKKKKTK